MKDVAGTAFAILVLGIAAAAVAIGWRWGSNRGMVR